MTPPACVLGEPPVPDAAPDAPMGCATNNDCAAAAPVCDPGSLTCRTCVADVECGTDICLEYAGQCHNASNALFVAAGASGTTCSQAAPCTFTAALGQVANNRRVIAVADGSYAAPFRVLGYNANSLTVSGTDRDPAGAVVTSPDAGFADLFVDVSQKPVIVEGITLANGVEHGVENLGTLTLSRVAITGNAQDGINSAGALQIWDSQIATNSGQGIDIVQGTAEILRCLIDNNGNGGVDVTAAGFTLENNSIVRNGSLTSVFGGVRFQSVAGQTPQVFAFNTVATNARQIGSSGVQCDDTIALDSSILVDPVDTNCAATYSLFTGAVPAGGANIQGDPMFVSPTTGDYHVMATSPARDAANPAATTATDIDGELRPLGAARDIGADELP